MITRFIIHGLLVFIVFGCYAYISYHPTFKSNNWFYPLGIVLSVAASLLWLGFIKHVGIKQQIVMFNLGWNLIVLLAFYSIPIVVYKVSLTPISWLGLAMGLSGLIIFRLGILGS